MIENNYINQLELILVELLDGQEMWYEIYEHTGLPEERCKEIEAIYNKIVAKHKGD